MYYKYISLISSLFMNSFKNNAKIIHRTQILSELDYKTFSLDILGLQPETYTVKMRNEGYVRFSDAELKMALSYGRDHNFYDEMGFYIESDDITEISSMILKFAEVDLNRLSEKLECHPQTLRRIRNKQVKYIEAVTFKELLKIATTEGLRIILKPKF